MIKPKRIQTVRGNPHQSANLFMVCDISSFSLLDNLSQYLNINPFNAILHNPPSKKATRQSDSGIIRVKFGFHITAEFHIM